MAALQRMQKLSLFIFGSEQVWFTVVVVRYYFVRSWDKEVSRHVYLARFAAHTSTALVN